MTKCGLKNVDRGRIIVAESCDIYISYGTILVRKWSTVRRNAAAKPILLLASVSSLALSAGNKAKRERGGLCYRILS